jgi:hypothetical protein
VSCRYCAPHHLVNTYASLVIAITLALGKGFLASFVAVGLTMWVEVAQ